MRTSALLWLWLVVVPLACEPGSASPQAGSESHFLVTCNATCAGGFECLCGVCTETCAGDATCTSILAEATCVDVASRPQSSRCDDTKVEAFCDVKCATDTDCHSLGSDFACSDGFCREGAGTGTSDPIALQDVCSMYVADVCRAKLDCFDWDYDSYDACLAAQECDGFAELNQLLGRGSVRYDAAATGACHARLQVEACSLSPILFDVPTLPEALAMCDALTGQLTEGAACESNLECAEGLSCDLEAACPGKCVVPAPRDELPAGAACVTEICVPAQAHCSQCALGLDCIGQVCVKTPAVGDSCMGVLGCGDALWCNGATGRCAPKAQLGEACSDFRQAAPDCAAGLWCDDPPASPTQTGLCHEPSRSGQPCRSDLNCIEPFTCLPTPGGTPIDPGVCGDKQANGGACDSFDDCESHLCSQDVCTPLPALGETCVDTCAEGLTCANTGNGSLCVTKRYAGEPCGDGAACINSRCVAGACTNRGHFGDGCATADDCLSNHCAGTCIDPTGCPE
jgi:hypothetical protein